jgi:hypothetical protein
MTRTVYALIASPDNDRTRPHHDGPSVAIHDARQGLALLPDMSGGQAGHGLVASTPSRGRRPLGGAASLPDGQVTPLLSVHVVLAVSDRAATRHGRTLRFCLRCRQRDACVGA